jgi:AcrR family transcriptional regulator
VSVSTNSDRISKRREATRAEILEAAWELAREHGLAGLSLRDLGARVGMRAQSLYGYFASKHDIYDAMFADGYRAYRAHMQTAVPPDGPADRGEFKAGARAFFEFCTSDPVRYQLLFQRTIPGFEPSPESYAIALAALEDLRPRLAALGITDPRAIDLQTALMTGLTDQQISNDPGGDRWERLVDEAMDMYLDHVLGPEREGTA